MNENLRAALLHLRRCPDFFGKAMELIQFNGWTSSSSWVTSRYTLQEAIELVVARFSLWKEDIPMARRAIDTVLCAAAGEKHIETVMLLSDSQLPDEGKRWANSLLVSARGMVMS